MRPQTTAPRLAATALAFLVLPIAAARAADEDGFVRMFNGEPVIDMDIGLTDLKNRPARGRISFQDEGKPVWSRNVCAATIKTGRRRQLKLPSWEGGFSG